MLPKKLGAVVAWTLFATVAVSASAQNPAPTRVTRMKLAKSTHTLTLYDGERVVTSFTASIGPGGAGFKQREGDDVTPVGEYRVIGHQPSKYRIFLPLDYPNAEDRARFAARKARGELPVDAHIGGDIGIHGTPQGHQYDAVRPTLRGEDWTAGCIAVQDDEIDRIAAWVRDGTVIDIED